MTIDQDVAFTQEWWKRTCADKDKMVAWVQKLYLTEIGGHDDYQNFLRMFEATQRTTLILQNIAQDEKKHAGILENLLDARGFKLNPDAPPSEYWKTLDSHITNLDTACAANYYGEALAAFRFEVIVDMDCTPEDVQQALRIILPDEQFHRTTLRRLASDETLARFKQIHDDAVMALRGQK